MIRSDLRTYLAANAGLTALLTRSGRKHIYLSRVPQSTPAYANFPCVVYRRANGGHEHDLDGSAGYAAPQFEFHVLAQDPDDVEGICEALRQALQGFKGAMGDTTVDRCTLEDESDDYLESRVGDDVGFHRTVLIYKIGFRESIPTF